MENHPIPQDVTGFKFKLIGSVTVKQFLYILGGGILAGICFILPASGLIKIPLAALFGGLGAAVAFIPIEGRPMDVMLKNFLKALPAENQYIFRKKGAEALIFDFFTPRPQAAVKPQAAPAASENERDSKRALLYKTLKTSNRPDEKEQAVLTNINQYLNESSHSASPTVQRIDDVPKDIPSPLQIVTPSVTIATKEVKEVPATPIMPSIPSTPAAAQPTAPDPQVVISVAQKIQNLDTNADSKLVVPEQPTAAVALQNTVQEEQPSTTSPKKETVSRIDTPLPQNPVPVSTPLESVAPKASAIQAVAPDQSANVTTVTPEASLKAGFPQLPDTPNIVLGIIRDPRGKVLPNILVEIMNEQGVPVRAFKTNALGQFAAATPLPNGNYLVILEDPRKQNEFEQIQIILEGKIFNPLEIFSVDQREKLRRELFGVPAAQPAA